MTTQQELLDATYPDMPGYKALGPSQEAAQSMADDAATLRHRVWASLRMKPRTADECAEYLGESILSIRPRFSELRASGLIADSGLRRPNSSGRSATVWRAA
jgi:predicted ArsR family transcriptional regulator